MLKEYKICIGILSTARSISHKELSNALQWLECKGYTYKIGRTIGAVENQFAGSLQLRIDDFQEMIEDPKIDVIWCARGGYGTVQLIDNVDFSPLFSRFKPIVGYSDITVLHSHLHCLGLPSVHATMPINFGSNTKEAINSLERVFDCLPNTYQWQMPYSYANQQIEGVLVGGNLSVLYSILGSVSSIDTTDKILLIEDVDEYLYHIDRMLRNLDRNGMLCKLKALVVGGFTKLHDNATPYGKSVSEIIFDIAGGYGYPIIYNAPFGHIEDNRAFLLGHKAVINLENNQITLQQNTDFTKL